MILKANLHSFGEKVSFGTRQEHTCMWCRTKKMRSDAFSEEAASRLNSCQCRGTSDQCDAQMFTRAAVCSYMEETFRLGGQRWCLAFWTGAHARAYTRTRTHTHTVGEERLSEANTLQGWTMNNMSSFILSSQPDSTRMNHNMSVNKPIMDSTLFLFAWRQQDNYSRPTYWLLLL